MINNGEYTSDFSISEYTFLRLFWFSSRKDLISKFKNLSLSDGLKCINADFIVNEDKKIFKPSSQS